MDERPQILTLVLDEPSQERFDALRREHFPPERNHLQAHVTLFHALPGEQERALAADLDELARRPAYDVDVVRVRSLGRGVAYDLRSPVLAAQRQELARRWSPWLTRQDAAPHAPHVTVQNKVDPQTARELHASLAASFTPEGVPARGLGLWRYLGGPWAPEGEHPFG